MTTFGMLVAFFAGLVIGGLAMSATALWRSRSERRGPYDALVRTAFARIAADDHAGAAESLRQACRIDSGDDAVYLLLGSQLRRSGDASRAAQVADLLLARRDQRPEIAAAAWLLKGRLAEAVERYDDALAAYAMAAERDPGSVQALVARGRLLSRMRRWPDAIEVGDRLTKLNPQRGKLIAARRRVLLATELLAEGRAKEALSEAETALSDVDDLAAAHLSAGDAKFQLGRVGEAARSWQTSARLAPAISPLVVDRLEQLGAVSGDRDRARQFATEVAEGGGSWRVVAWLAADALARGAPLEAQRWCEELERVAPRSASAARLRARCDASMSESSPPPRLAATLAHWSDEPPWTDPWSCRRCGHRDEEFEWRCSSCHAWGSSH